MKLIILISVILLTACAPETREKAWAGLIGFSEGYNAYGNYNYNTSTDYTYYKTTQDVYSKGQCTGPIVGGACHGGVIGAPQAICYGNMLNGQCIGTLIPH